MLVTGVVTNLIAMAQEPSAEWNNTTGELISDEARERFHLHTNDAVMTVLLALFVLACVSFSFFYTICMPQVFISLGPDGRTSQGGYTAPPMSAYHTCAPVSRCVIGRELTQRCV